MRSLPHWAAEATTYVIYTTWHSMASSQRAAADIVDLYTRNAVATATARATSIVRKGPSPLELGQKRSHERIVLVPRITTNRSQGRMQSSNGGGEARVATSKN